jgi:hypothetical protein
LLIRLGNELTAADVRMRRVDGGGEARRGAKSTLLSSPRAGQSRSKRTKASYVSVPDQVPGKVT